MSESSVRHVPISSSDTTRNRPILLVPVGAFEQHGPHLPLDTDTQIAVALCDATFEACEKRGTPLVVGPPLTVTASDEHRGFTGTLSIGTEATAEIFSALAESASWSRGVVFVNGHGGNADAITLAHDRLARRNITHTFWSVTGYATNDSHAGRGETSLMLHVAPHLVRSDKFVTGNTNELSTLLATMRTSGVQAVSPNGVLGDPHGANAEEGKELFARNVASLVDCVVTCNQRWE